MHRLYFTFIFAAGWQASQGASFAQSPQPMLTSDVSVAAAAIRGPGRMIGRTITPESSRERPQDIGRRAHTNYKVFVPAAGAQPQVQAAVNPNAGAPPYSGYYDETPASLACIYGSAVKANGCDPNKVTAPAKGGSKAIALVDAYDAPNAATDLATFSTQFGLPAPNLTIVYATGTQPAYNAGWAGESTLDIEMAHAMSPNAKIYLVEAATNNFTDLNVAVDKAYQLVSAAGGGEISMSYGASESSAVTGYESHFDKPGALFFASTGDAPGVNWPSSSPHVIAVGGTSTSREMVKAATFGAFLEETAWSETGGGISQYFAAPSFQSATSGRFGTTMRTVPDIAAIASDLTRVWVRFNGDWVFFAGTSVASPLAAGIANKWIPQSTTTTTELQYIYSRIGTASYFDVKQGVCGPAAGFFASATTAASPALAYDLCTGVGAPRGSTAF